MAKGKWEQVEEKFILIEAWARDGLIDEQIAKNLGIGKTTFYDYKKKHPELSELLKKNKEVIDIQVENSLLKKAIGYTTTLNKQKVTKDGDVINVTEEIHVPGDTTALIFWLKNRKPKTWRDKQEIELDIPKKITVNLTDE